MKLNFLIFILLLILLIVFVYFTRKEKQIEQFQQCSSYTEGPGNSQYACNPPCIWDANCLNCRDSGTSKQCYCEGEDDCNARFGECIYNTRDGYCTDFQCSRADETQCRREHPDTDCVWDSDSNHCNEFSCYLLSP